jgi:metal-responsive CopG/Arc/MetJ family transcriptional regulator
MSHVRTGISLQDVLLKEADTIAQELDIPRSQMFSLALQEFIRRYRNRKLLEQINDAYSTSPEPNEIENMEIIHSHRRKIGRSDGWK